MNPPKIKKTLRRRVHPCAIGNTKDYEPKERIPRMHHFAGALYHSGDRRLSAEARERNK
jgi:hypothetical protein